MTISTGSITELNTRFLKRIQVLEHILKRESRFALSITIFGKPTKIFVQLVCQYNRKCGRKFLCFYPMHNLFYCSINNKIETPDPIVFPMKICRFLPSKDTGIIMGNSASIR